jgi:choline-sulfatase
MNSPSRRPNILLIQVDQMAAPALPVYGHPLVKAPNIAALAQQSVVFDNAYCNSPICASSRYSMLSGRLPSAIQAFDNASEFSSAIPTLAHYLRSMGYSATLSGKMHFVGPDQLHGYEERLTTDIYPSDFSWTPNWTEGPKNKPTGISMSNVVDSGVCARSLQIDYDEEVEFNSLQKLYDLARFSDEKPFFLTVSFTHPHSPYTTLQKYWDLYPHDGIDMPAVPPIPLDQMDEQSRWLYYSHGRDLHTVTDEHVRNARHAYYGMITYIDEKVGRLLSTLEAVGLRENTVIVFTSDHGEMLGERGMWYKQTFFEWSSRVPFMISCPEKFKPSRVSRVVSLVDLMPTLLDLASEGSPPATATRLDGQSMVPLLHGDDGTWPDVAISEYSDMGVCAPCRMLRRGKFKYVYTHGFPAQLFDLEADPSELENLAGKGEFQTIEEDLGREILKGWDPEVMHQAVLESQRRRLFIQRVTEPSPYFDNWSYVVRQGDRTRYVRAGTGGSTNTKAKARFPYVVPVPPDKAQTLVATHEVAPTDLPMRSRSK